MARAPSRHPSWPDIRCCPPSKGKEFLDAVEDFELLLKDYGIKKAGIIAKNIADTGTPNIFDDGLAIQKKKWLDRMGYR